MFSRLYEAIKFICSAPWFLPPPPLPPPIFAPAAQATLSQIQMKDCPTLSYTTTSKIPAPFHIPEA